MLLRRVAPTRALVLALALAACGESAQPPPDQPVVRDPRCNGAVELCARRFDEVSFATAHNAMSNEADEWFAPNQAVGITGLLEAGVRGFMIDTYDFKGVPSLCHVVCDAGNKPLVDGLLEFRAFLLAHPREVIALIVENHLPADRTEAAFADAGLLPLVHEQRAGEPWPTLETMIASGRRVVVFAESEGGKPAWYHDLFAWSWETHYSYKTADAMHCGLNRGNPDGDLFVLNHFLTNPFGGRHLAEQVNFNPFLRERAQRCAQEHGHLPNFVSLDFATVGDLLDVVRELNGLPGDDA